MSGEPMSAVLGSPCPCGRKEKHTPVMSLSMPIAVKTLVSVTKAVNKMLAESEQEAVFYTDGAHSTSVLYAVNKEK